MIDRHDMTQEGVELSTRRSKKGSLPFNCVSKMNLMLGCRELM